MIVKAIALATQQAEPIPYHTSILSGCGWVLELWNGHPERIHMELGVHKHVFKALLRELMQHGHLHSKHIMLEEQLTIFLYIYITGLTIRHIGEHFQQSIHTIFK